MFGFEVLFYEADEERSAFFACFSFLEGSEEDWVDGVVIEVIVDVNVFDFQLIVTLLLFLHHYHL